MIRLGDIGWWSVCALKSQAITGPLSIWSYLQWPVWYQCIINITSLIKKKWRFTIIPCSYLQWLMLLYYWQVLIPNRRVRNWCTYGFFMKLEHLKSGLIKMNKNWLLSITLVCHFYINLVLLTQTFICLCTFYIRICVSSVSMNIFYQNVSKINNVQRRYI